MSNIVLFPFMAQGHFNPFVNLARLILHHHHCHSITIVTTPLNVSKLQSMLPPSAPIVFATLPFDPAAHGLPNDGECTDALPYPLIVKLFFASRTLRPALEQLLTSLISGDGHARPLCLICDTFFGWTVDVARQLGIRHVLFSTAGAYGTVAFFSLWIHLPQTKTDSDEFCLPNFPEIRLHRSQLANHAKVATGYDPWSVFLTEELSLSLGTSTVLVNTALALEPKSVKRLSTMFESKPIHTIGPLLPSILFSSRPQSAMNVDKKQQVGKRHGISVNECQEWLDLRPIGSVLYISFGSQNTISLSQMKTLAMGLEESGVGFIWVVRPPVEFPLDEEFKSLEWLPERFEERMKEKKQGLVLRNWAPQLAILAHESTGAFLSHCGWNSAMESLSCGVPIIGWPISAEQFYNAKMMEEEMGVCMEMARGNQAEIRKEDVLRVVSLVIGETQKREEMRKKAGEAREVLREAWANDVNQGATSTGPSLSSFNSFIDSL